jgi:SAM-dependent methyltransferase
MSGSTSEPTVTARQQPCDLCGGLDFELIGRSDRRGRPLDTCVCRRCGLVSHAELPSHERLAEFYRDQYRLDYHGESWPSPRRVLRAWNTGGRLVARLLSYVGPADRVLEIGAGLGATVKQFELAGREAAGIEPHGAFGRYSRECLRADVRAGSLFDLPADETWDFVLLVHVIEHFRSPREALERIRGLLRPGGRLYIECPNLAAPFAPPGRCFHFAHVHNFTPATLAMLAERCGFTVERSFGPADDPNLMLLVRRGGAKSAQLDPHSYAQTMAALGRYSALTYHLRPGYLWRRAAKVAGYLRERLTAEREVARIVAACQAAAAPRILALPAAAPARERRAA